MFAHDAEWYDAHQVEVLTGSRAEAIDLERGRVTLADRELAYDRLLLATGATPRRLPMADEAGVPVTYLRTLEDSVALKERLTGRIVIVGAGWIGLEVAAAAREAGAEVTVVEQASQPLEAVLGPEIGAVFADLHREHGVDLRLGTSVDPRRWPRPTWSWSGSAPRRTTTWPAPPGWPATTACSSTPGCARATRTCSRPATSPATTIRCSAGSGWSTGTRRSTRARPPPARCWATMRRTTGCRTSSPISTTSAWSTSDTPVPATTRWWSAATARERKLQAYWLRAGTVVAGMHLNDWDAIDTIRSVVGGPLPEELS